jgi:hypothetical protein
MQAIHDYQHITQQLNTGSLEIVGSDLLSRLHTGGR